MNASNPFQVPACFQRADLQQRRRERFKRFFFIVTVALAAAIVAVLIQGCKTEEAAAGGSTRSADTARVGTAAHGNGVLAPVPQLDSSALPPPSLSPRRAGEVAKVRPDVTASPVPRTLSLYIVKRGDTLSRIARGHGTTVGAIKTANHLDTDRILIGQKLSIPQS